MRKDLETPWIGRIWFENGSKLQSPVLSQRSNHYYGRKLERASFKKGVRNMGIWMG